MRAPIYTFKGGRIHFGEPVVCEMWTHDRDGVAAMIGKANAANHLADILQRALPVVEDAAADPAYKPGAMKAFAAEITAALAKIGGAA